MLIYKSFKLSLLTIFLTGCSGLEKSELKKARQRNLLIEPVYQSDRDPYFLLSSPLPSPHTREPYPWENKYIGKHLRITKEFFRCRGHPLNPLLRIQNGNQGISYQQDCSGGDRHSLPIRTGKEFVYPILLDLLNLVQEKTGRRVIITSGHRCPTHNIYVDPSQKNRTSKHLIGAAVDFYVEEMEYVPKVILQILQNYDQKNPLQKMGDNIWSNREILVELHNAKTDRNGDNQHPYPYFSISVKYDGNRKKPIEFSWKEAYQGYYRN